MSSFSVRGLIVAVAFAAVACAALIKPSEIWVVILLGITSALLVGGPVAALATSAARRQFWIGFSVVGWGYFLLVWIASNTPFQSNTPVIASNVDYFLPTQWLLIVAADHVINDPTDPWRNVRGGGSTTGGGFFQVGSRFGSGMSAFPGPPATTSASSFPIIGPRAAFLLSGHLLWTLLFAYIGGSALRYSYLRRARRHDGAAAAAA